MVRASAPKPALVPKGALRAAADRAAYADRLYAERLRAKVPVTPAKPRFSAARDRLNTVFAQKAKPTLGQTFRTATSPSSGRQQAAKLALSSKSSGGNVTTTSGSAPPKLLTPTFNAAASRSLMERVKAASTSLRSAKPDLRFDSRLRGHPVIARGAQAFDLVDKAHREQVKGSFQGPVAAYKLTRPMVVHRIYSSGQGSERQGNYFSRFPYKDVLRAARKLALPSANDLSRKATYILPAGTIILVGKVAPKAGEPGFPETATGGGEQVVVLDRGLPYSLRFESLDRLP